MGRNFDVFPGFKKNSLLCVIFTVPLGDWLEKKKATAIIMAIIIKQQFGFPKSTT